ncbi:anhydro-N-acetylmuramic acid kinase [Mariprofundus sp. EBB-1]|uniref:anhydro-N-acetylmuramic acid kinase n=1 Tax=Mariprofundus sp. EBB-1 TaxID=2650971 RepID=UPI000EF2543F|nr:anhydro-N-acetylmuramic acid kinase [Mariprofundus sp. EBB-1]RLL51598.1 anhydro-N-acetylmuramic acid kinase [Mariprofundus sp. EBB-1]
MPLISNHASAPLFIGMMSGTSADGIDVAVVRSGEKPELLQFNEFPMPDSLRQTILHLAVPENEEGNSEIDAMGELDRALGNAYAEAVLKTLKQAGIHTDEIAAIGCHGQTIRHRPESLHPFTLQIGCASTVSEVTGITCVSNFRSRDIAAGGEGAPLVPFAHRHLFASNQHNTAIVNIGGIANLTWIDQQGHTTGFDIGPGNMLMDALMVNISAGEKIFDQDGAMAASGQVSTLLLARLMTHPFLKRTPPKSTGREAFGEDIVQQIIGWPDLSDADRMATACAFTAEAIVESMMTMIDASCSDSPASVLICGGGARNKHLMALLTEKLAPANVQRTDAVGIPAQAVEAISFALLARHTLMGTPNTLAAVTGASHNVCGGQITPGNNWASLLQTIPVWNQ